LIIFIVLKERMVVLKIALLAHDRRKELMVQFCIAYCGVLANHSICATNTTGHLVSEATGLPITLYLSCNQGGSQQIGSLIAYNEIDIVLFFCDPLLVDEYQGSVKDITQLCDQYNIPFASNVATAEVLILGLKRGDLDRRDFVDPK
jgi:methylglyoxal synthase